jgi:hypothetical protein
MESKVRKNHLFFIIYLVSTKVMHKTCQKLHFLQKISHGRSERFEFLRSVRRKYQIWQEVWLQERRGSITRRWKRFHSCPKVAFSEPSMPKNSRRQSPGRNSIWPRFTCLIERALSFFESVTMCVCVSVFCLDVSFRCAD